VPTNELYVLVPGKATRWLQIKTKGQPPKPRYMHSLDYYEKDNILIVSAGRNDQEKEVVMNDIWVLYLDQLLWSQVMLSRPPLISRSGHCSGIFHGKLILFGGWTKDFLVTHTYEMVDLN